ncbi:MAG TPA: trehalase family glycosidase, partial [Deinococcales bacterium]|nr:trehalase family glycosidase [Deinococcales bacterium]
MPASVEAVRKVDAAIRSLWDSTVREAPEDQGTLIRLPHPYTVPCPQGRFQEMYYWDTFYTNEGLIAHGRVDLARQNTENLLSLVERFGFVPNGNRTFYLNRSQPPHLLLMVESVHRATGDDAWLEGTLDLLEREHAFWMARRLGPGGLNHYGHAATPGELEQLFEHVSKRWRDWPEAVERPAAGEASELTAECESGWDFTPRFAGRCETSEAVDLNALLYHHEATLA